jgi:hypothetical protein
MKMKATVSGGNLSRSAAKLLPDLVSPALAGLARTLQRSAKANGVVLVETQGPEGPVLTDITPGAFGREFGTLNSPPDPVLTDTISQMQAGLPLPQADTGDA